MIRRSVIVVAVVGLAAACEFPTEPPRWDQTWVVPGAAIAVSVAELLPPGVGLNGDGTAFVTDVPGSSVQFSLNDMCPTTCAPLDGLVAPKPEFSDTISTSTSLPADLVTATLSGGSFGGSMAHNFNFDPLRPSSDPDNPRGFITIKVTSDGNLVAGDSIHGDDQAFPGGSGLALDLAVQPVDITNELDIEIVIYSPAGDPVLIETDDTLGVGIATSTIEIAEITVAAGSITVPPDTIPAEFGGIDASLVERIQSGALRFDVRNPFTVTGSLDVEFRSDGFDPIQRSLSIMQGDYEDRIEFSTSELRSILGAEDLSVVTAGTVGSASGTITVTPAQELSMENEFELVVLIGPTEDL